MEAVLERPGPGGLPEVLTSFVGRRNAVAQVRARMSHSRLVTLVGAPGVGKTRLALEVAQSSRRAFSGRVYMVDLASLHDADNVPDTFLAALDIREQSTRSAEEKLVDHLRERLALVLLDNCEHVVKEVAVLTARLLRWCPRLHLLATSREPLDIEGEHVYTVPPLKFPDPEAPPSLEAMREYESVQLLVDRATAVRADFAVTDQSRVAVAQLCARLDGLPLAIELAATRLRSWEVSDVVERLDHRFAVLAGGRRDLRPRQQTLQRLLDWSFELCSKQERAVWARLSVFAGSFDLEAAEDVCSSDDLPAHAVGLVLDQLVAKSLIAIDCDEEPLRYRMLATVRDYGATLLAASGEENDLRQRHRNHYLRLAREIRATWLQQAQGRSLARLRRDHPNLRAALAWSLERPEEAQAGASLAAALEYHWYGGAFLSEGLRWLEQALEAAPEPTQARAEALWMAGLLALARGEIERSSKWIAECSEVVRANKHPALSAMDARGRALVRMFSGDARGSLEYFEGAIAGHWAAGRVAWALSAHYEAIVAFAFAGEYARARELSHDAMAMCDRHGDRWARGFVHWSTGVLEWCQGHLEAAREHARAALADERELERGLCVAYSIELLSWVAAAEDALEDAIRLQGAARSVWNAMGTGTAQWPQIRDESARVLERAAADLGEARCAQLIAERAEMTMRQAIDFALGVPRTPSGASELAPTEASPLSRREREVADLIADGKSNKAIAETLVVSPRTVHGHVERIMAKLGFHSRAQIASWVTERRPRAAR